MAKTPPFSCTKCGAQYPRWTGRCTECGSWSTIVEQTAGETSDPRPTTGTSQKPGTVETFASLQTQTNIPRQSIGLDFFDRILSGGLVAGSVTLVSGEPGIGKSTLLAQAAIAIAATHRRVLYVTGEESPTQVAMRLKRLAPKLPETLLFVDATDVGTVAATIMHEKPDLAIVDSIQSLTMQEVAGTSGSPTQVKACSALLTEIAKHHNVPTILVGQVTKDGEIAGPRLLEHIVDTVLMLEGDHDERFRILRVFKNRFGAADDVAVLTMTEDGLQNVDDPSAELIRERPMNTSGSIVSCLMEGHRPMLIELQALVTPAGYGTPVRRTTGIDSSRLGLLLAVLAKRATIRALDKDVYANAAGGIRAREPALDLAICLAIASGTSDISINPKIAAFGEVGLGGEIRPVSFPEARVRECERHGFNTVILPKGSKIKNATITVIEVESIREAIEKAMGR
ncbi:MAG: DNA repair protein RadA [Candidatus Uhrbacteria bacterium]|nr:DNA repair protein RadA [Candidatus Uhrbacteria bacterium]